MRVFSVAKKLYSLPLQRMWFSELPRDLLAPKKMEDWEYCRQISQNLSSSQYESAFSLFVHSYLERQILNLQIYHQAYQKLNSSSLPSTYLQVLYLMYRQQFQPHPLMSNWMTKMIPTENQHLEKILLSDFQALKIPYPQRISIRHFKRQGRRDKSDKESKADNNEESSTRRRTQRSSKIDVQNVPDEIQLPDIQMIQSGQPIEEAYRSKLQSGIKQLLKGLNLDLNSCSKIVVHDIEVEFVNDEGDEDINSISSEDIEYAQDFAEQAGNEMGFIGPDIKKIKVGKIELFNDKPHL